MRAMVLERVGGPLALRKVPAPEPESLRVTTHFGESHVRLVAD